MIGRLVRYQYTNEIGIVLRREITRKGNFRYWVFIGGKIQSFALPCLEVINAERWLGASKTQRTSRVVYHHGNMFGWQPVRETIFFET